VVFYLGWAQGFPRKNLCVHYFPHICLLLCPNQAARSTRLSDLRKFDKNTIHPPLVFSTLKLTQRENSPMVTNMTQRMVVFFVLQVKMFLLIFLAFVVLLRMGGMLIRL